VSGKRNTGPVSRGPLGCSMIERRERMRRKTLPNNVVKIREGKVMEYSCPSYLDPLAAEEWKRLIPFLVRLNVFTELDLSLVAGHCQTFSFWIRASELLMEEGLFLRRGDGTVMLNPLYRTVKSSGDMVLKTGAQLGMSPVSRAALMDTKRKGRGKNTKMNNRSTVSFHRLTDLKNLCGKHRWMRSRVDALRELRNHAEA